MSFDHKAFLELSRESFDPIFTDEFYKEAKKKDAKTIPIKFPMPTGKTDKEFAKALKGFLESKDGEQFKRGVGAIIQEIKKTIQDWKIKSAENRMA